MDPQLSHYTQFYIVLGNLSKNQLITPEQKQFMKTRLIKKDSQLCKLLIENAGPGREYQLRELFLAFIKDSYQPVRNRRGYKSKTVHFEIRAKSVIIEPTRISHLIENFQKLQQNSPVQEENKHDEDDRPISLCPSTAIVMEQLESLLTKHCEKQGLVTVQERLKLGRLRDLINNTIDERMEIESFSPLRARFSSNSSKVPELAEESEESLASEAEDDRIQRQVTDIYHELKKVFTGNLNTHLLLMQEEVSYGNIFSVLKYMVKTLVDADEYSFFIHREQEWELYSTQSDSIEQLSKSDQANLIQEANYIKPLYAHRITNKTNPYHSIQTLGKTNQYFESYLLKFVTQQNCEVIFLFHWADKDKKNIKRRFVANANSYSYTDLIIQKCTFLVTTIITARVSFFNPLKFADQIQDIGISFMRISRYLLIDGIRKTLKLRFDVEKEQALSQDEVTFKGRDPPKMVRIEMHDTHPVSLVIKDMDLSREWQRNIYSHIIRLQERYDSYVNLCHEKAAFYKYFLRTGDSLLFDFNKKGELIFLSRPISSAFEQQFQLKFDPKTILCQSTNYQEIFENNDILSNIEGNIQSLSQHNRNQYFSATEDSSFELFLKVVDDDFKGFSIILHENKERRITNELKSLKLDNEVYSSDVQRSIRRQYNKHQTFKFLHNLEQTNKMDVRNSMIALFVPEADLAQLHRSRDNTIKRFDDEQASPRHSRRSALHAQQTFQLNKPPEFESFFQTYPEDDELDLFAFNVFDYTTILEKQRVVYSIFHRNRFLQRYQIQQTVLAQFLQKLERKYNKRNNPFHNYDHGIAVMQSAHFLCLCAQAKQYMNEIVRFATIVSALCHDVSHTGRTNLFEINSRSKLATRYHDKSPLEQHHAATALMLLRQEDSNFLSSLTKEDFTTFRRVFIENILYTDIKVHFDLLKDFEARVKESKQEGSKRFGECDEDVKMLTGMIVHTADFNGGAKVFEVSRVWSERVNVEFNAQYIEEGRLGIPQTPFLKDLDKLHVMAKSEMGFFKVIVRPLWATLNLFMENEIQVALHNLDNTIISWEKIHNANVPQ